MNMPMSPTEPAVANGRYQRIRKSPATTQMTTATRRGTSLKFSSWMNTSMSTQDYKRTDEQLRELQDALITHEVAGVRYLLQHCAPVMVATLRLRRVFRACFSSAAIMRSPSHLHIARSGIKTFSRRQSGDEVFAGEGVRRFAVGTAYGACRSRGGASGWLRRPPLHSVPRYVRDRTLGACSPANWRCRAPTATA